MGSMQGKCFTHLPISPAPHKLFLKSRSTIALPKLKFWAPERGRQIPPYTVFMPNPFVMLLINIHQENLRWLGMGGRERNTNPFPTSSEMLKLKSIHLSQAPV